MWWSAFYFCGFIEFLLMCHLRIEGCKTRIRISSSWRSIGESHVVRSWPSMKSKCEKSVSRFCVIETQ
jgi:hypothetical protein